MNEETELIKKYIEGRLNIELIRGKEEGKRNKKGQLTINDKVSRWAERLKRINAHLLYFCDLPIPDKEQMLKRYDDVTSPVLLT